MILALKPPCLLMINEFKKKIKPILTTKIPVIMIIKRIRANDTSL